MADRASILHAHHVEHQSQVEVARHHRVTPQLVKRLVKAMKQDSTMLSDLEAKASRKKESE